MEPFPKIGRPVYKPCYTYANQEPLEHWSVIDEQPEGEFGNRFCGRFVTIGRAAEGRFPEEWLDLLGPCDIVYIGLYEGGPHPHNRGSGLAQLPHHEHNLAMLKEIAPRVAGITAGNCGAELAYHHLICDAADEQKVYSNVLCARFADRVGRMIAEAGGTPVFGTMDRDVLIDCYHGDGLLAKTIDRYGGWQMIYDEWFLPELDSITGAIHGQEIADPLGQFVALNRREEYPYRRLLEYFDRWKIGCAIGYLEQLEHSYDQMLTFHGADHLMLANWTNADHTEFFKRRKAAHREAD